MNDSWCVRNLPINDVLKRIERNQRTFFIVFAAVTFVLALLGTFLLKSMNFTILWILFPIIYFILILLLNNYKLNLLIIGVAFAGYYLGLAIAGTLVLEIHVIYTLLLLGFGALIIAQLSIHKIVISSFGEIEHKRIILIYTVLYIIGSFAVAGVFMTIPTPANAQQIGIISSALVLVINSSFIGYMSKRFWASFTINLALMLFFIFPVFSLTKAFSIQQVMWMMSGGAVPSFAILIQNVLIITPVFGGLFGLIGKYKQHTKPPITLTTPIDAAYVYRDRLSVMMLLGKNNFPEYEVRGDKVVFYNRMDVKMGFRPKHEIRLDIIDKEKVDVYLEKFAEREKIGTYKNPNYLRERYQPNWNLFGYALKAQLAKLLRPILLIISIGVVTFFMVSLGLTIAGLPPPIGWSIIIAAVSGVATIVLLVVFYLLISKKMTTVLEEHPEFSIAYIGLFIAVFLAAWFLSYLIQGALIAIASGNLGSYTGLLGTNLWYLMLVTLLVGLASIQVLGVQNYNTYFYHKDMNVFKDPNDEPVWLDDKAYWVFRYAYEFPGEFTISSSQIYHEDIERMDVWVNAKTGLAEWLVGDYHWREIWTRIPKSKDIMIGVNFSVNFHTPVYYILKMEQYEKYLEIKSVRQLLSYFWGELKKAFRQFISLLAFWTRKVYREVEDELVIIKKPPKDKVSNWTIDFFTDVPAPFRRACADYLASIPWNFLRYPYGVENVKGGELLYREPEVTPPRWPEKVPPEPGKGTDAMDARRICPKCGYINDFDRWNCEVCKTDGRKYTAYTLNAPQRLKRVKGWFTSAFRRTTDEEKEQQRLKEIEKREKLEAAKTKVETEKEKRKKLDKYSELFLKEEDREKMKDQAKTKEQEAKSEYKELKGKSKEENSKS